MMRQLSGAPCQEGSTWGYDARGIWVDRGCRAEFSLSGGVSNNGGDHNYRAITFASTYGNPKYCNDDPPGGLLPLRTANGAPCCEGASLAGDPPRIWEAPRAGTHF